jgi:hypothetical protein
MIVDGSDWPYQARVKIFECMDRRGGDGIALGDKLDLVSVSRDAGRRFPFRLTTTERGRN